MPPRRSLIARILGNLALAVSALALLAALALLIRGAVREGREPGTLDCRA